MTYKALTKQDLLARLKEHREAAKQREADILGRVKSLEARNKYVKELKTWLDRRKSTTADLLAMYRTLQPKRADRPVKSKKPLQPSPNRLQKSAAEHLVEAMQRERMVEINASAARDLVEKLGFSRGSYSHIINSAMTAGLLRKGARLEGGPGYMYVLAGGARVPAATPKAAKAKANDKHGDPAFCAAIRKGRTEKGWEREETGKKLGVSWQSIANWENGRYTPKEEMRQKIVKLFGLPEDLGAAATAAATAHGRPVKSTNGAAA